jgi:hypothetical protein
VESAAHLRMAEWRAAMIFRAVLVFVMCAVSARAASMQISTGAYSSGKAYVSCVIDGVKERCFLDTGSAMTLVANSKRFSAYTNVGNFRFESASGIPEQTQTILIGSIQIDGVELRDKKVGRTSFRGAENTLGIDVVGRQPFSVNFNPQGVLKLNAERPDLPLTTLQVSRQGLLSIPMEIGAVEAHALWDTGVALTTIDQNFISAHPENFKAMKNYMNGVDGAGKSILVQVFRAKKLKIADRTFKDVRVVGVDLTMLRQGVNKDIQAVIGFNLIRKANWFFDPKNRLWSCDTKL